GFFSGFSGSGFGFSGSFSGFCSDFVDSLSDSLSDSSDPSYSSSEFSSLMGTVVPVPVSSGSFLSSVASFLLNCRITAWGCSSRQLSSTQSLSEQPHGGTSCGLPFLSAFPHWLKQSHLVQ